MHKDRPRKGQKLEVLPPFALPDEWTIGKVTCLLSSQFIVDVGGMELFLFYKDKGCTWRVP